MDSCRKSTVSGPIASSTCEMCDAGKKRVLQFVVLGASMRGQSYGKLLYSQVLCPKHLIGSQCIAKSEACPPRVAIELNDMNQVCSFTAIATSPKDEVIGNPGILGI